MERCPICGSEICSIVYAKHSRVHKTEEDIIGCDDCIDSVELCDVYDDEEPDVGRDDG